ncbi:MAG: septum formation protein Maf [Clostridiales bacterium]|jgi:septum formation protein|nr:septum formation protein Maf [Clostridiales bacterium]
MLPTKLVLASASPRRRELLEQAGISYTLCPVDVDEHLEVRGAQLVEALAERKARAAWAKHPRDIILGADTMVYVDEQPLGKPQDAQDALRMLRLLQGRDHLVRTGVCVIDGPSGLVLCDSAQTTVYFDPMDDEEIRCYIASGEPYGKAGAYAVQGIAGLFVRRLEGSCSNVIGLPLHLVRALLGRIQNNTLKQEA